MIRQIARWFSLVMPPRWVVVLALVPLLFVEVVYLWMQYQFGPGPGNAELLKMRDGMAVILMVAYGAFRAMAFHPLWQRSYREWLALTPWNHRKPLPRGPIHLVLQDLAVLVLMVLVLHGTDTGRMFAILGFLLSYLVFLGASFWGTGPWWIGYLLVFSLGMVVRLMSIHWFAVVLLPVVYGVAWLGLQAALSRFPWPRWKVGETVDRLFPAAADRRRDPFKSSKRKLGWPYDQLGARRTDFRLLRRDALLAPLLAGWCVYAVAAAIPDSKHEVCGFLWMLHIYNLIGCCAWRIALYAAEHRPPISIFGRIATGRWIIPGYDRIFIAPLCAVAVGAISPIALHVIGMPDVIVFPLSISLVLLVILNMGPSFELWRLTGHHRIKSQLNRGAEFIRL